MTAVANVPTPAFAATSSTSAEAGSYAAQTQSMFERPQPAAVSLRALGEALIELSELEENWDSYGAAPPAQAALERAWLYLSALVEQGLESPEVFATRSGGVQLEWHHRDAELEWEIDASGVTGVFVFDDHVTAEQVDGELPRDTQVLVNVLSRLHRG